LVLLVFNLDKNGVSIPDDTFVNNLLLSVLIFVKYISLNGLPKLSTKSVISISQLNIYWVIGSE